MFFYTNACQQWISDLLASGSLCRADRGSSEIGIEILTHESVTLNPEVNV